MDNNYLSSISNFDLFRLILEKFGIEVKDENDIKAAWQVVEEMDCGFMQWDVGVFEVELTKECITGFASADTASLAIYRAALAI